jgi:hypothetical protein
MHYSSCSAYPPTCFHESASIILLYPIYLIEHAYLLLIANAFPDDDDGFVQDRSLWSLASSASSALGKPANLEASFQLQRLKD